MAREILKAFENIFLRELNLIQHILNQTQIYVLSTVVIKVFLALWFNLANKVVV